MYVHMGSSVFVKGVNFAIKIRSIEMSTILCNNNKNMWKQKEKTKKKKRYFK